MRSFDKNDPWDLKEMEKLNAEQWQIDLLGLNPYYVYWGPGEDYMCVKEGWNSEQYYKTWKDFGPWGLDELNDVVNFYFSVERESVPCVACEETGYAPKAKQIADNWYDFAETGRKWNNNTTQDEVQALVDDGRLRDLQERFGRTPTANEVNKWQKGTEVGHDAINHGICVEQRLAYELYCPECGGAGFVYTAPKAHVELTLWILHPRKGASRGVRIMSVEQNDLPEIFAYLKEAAQRNADRFSKLP